MLGYFSGLSLGDRGDDHLVCLAQVETRRADQVADVLDEQHTVVDVQFAEGPVDHFCVQVAALAGIHLQGGNAGGADTIRVRAGFLITFDDRQVHLIAESLQGFHQQRGLARAR